MAAITPQVVERWKLALLRIRSRNTVRMRLRALKAAFSYAKRLRLVAENPAAEISPPAADQVSRVLSADELEALFAQMPPHVRRAAVFAVHSGLRLGAIVALDWKSVRQLPSGGLEMTVRRSSEVGAPGGHQEKTRRSRAVPIHPAAAASMGPPQPAGRVFEGVTRYMLQSWMPKASERAKIGRARFHDLKHTFCTRYMEATGDIDALSHIVGNTLGSLKEYIYLAKPRSEGLLRLDLGPVSHYSPTQEPAPGAGASRKRTRKTAL